VIKRGFITLSELKKNVSYVFNSIDYEILINGGMKIEKVSNLIQQNQ